MPIIMTEISLLNNLNVWKYTVELALLKKPVTESLTPTVYEKFL